MSTPLYKKLGIKEGMDLWVINTPKNYLDFFDEFPVKVIWNQKPEANKLLDFIHLFAADFQSLEDGIERAIPKLKTNGILWISWPKKTASLPSEIDKFDVMRTGQNAGLVDVKVCAIDHNWSGHKFVIPLKHR